MKRVNASNPVDVAQLVRVWVTESGRTPKNGFIPCEIDSNLDFSSESIQTYFFGVNWDPILFDALVVAAAVEYCDRIKKRPTHNWTREFEVHIPVHDPERWGKSKVLDSLQGLLGFLTGDHWKISFYRRKKDYEYSPQLQFNLNSDVAAVVPFSNGLDSHAVSWLMEKEYGQRLLRIRLKPNDSATKKDPFTAVPFTVHHGGQRFYESSVRSRGFKFSLIACLASYLSNAGRIIVPESGQGSLAPALISVGQAYEDLRSHPLFTSRMEGFVLALLGHKVKFVHPKIWNTKGETLLEYLNGSEDRRALWGTRSCWRHNWQVAVNGAALQCGVCAACMLRRLSLHTANADEPQSNYVWGNLSESSFKKGAAPGFAEKKITRSMEDYAIAGVLHMEHFARLLQSPLDAPMLENQAFQLSKLLDLDEVVVKKNLQRLISKHSQEWDLFLDSLDANSFILNWARVPQS